MVFVPGELSSGGVLVGEAKSLEDGIVEGRANLADFDVFDGGIDAIGEENNE